MKTQHQHAHAAAAHAAHRAHGFNFLLQQPHRPTAEEIQKLRAKRPSLWLGYHDKNPPKAEETV